MDNPTCGHCGTEIDRFTAPVIDMGNYGMEVHAACFAGLTAGQLLLLMGYDETCVRYPNGTVLRARDASAIQPDGTVTGHQEPVPW